MPPGLEDPSLMGLLTNIVVILGIASVIGATALIVWLLKPVSSTAYPSKASSDAHDRLKDLE